MIDKNKIPLTLSVTDSDILEMRKRQVDALHNLIAEGKGDGNIYACGLILGNIEECDMALAGDLICRNRAGLEVAVSSNKISKIKWFEAEQIALRKERMERLIDSGPDNGTVSKGSFLKLNLTKSDIPKTFEIDDSTIEKAQDGELAKLRKLASYGKFDIFSDSIDIVYKCTYALAGDLKSRNLVGRFIIDPNNYKTSKLDTESDHNFLMVENLKITGAEIVAFLESEPAQWSDS